MSLPGGKTLPLSVGRKLMCDFLHFSSKVPQVAIERPLDLSELIQARRMADPKIGWFSIFGKAYALVAVRYPELRRCYMSFPRPHLYEHQVNVMALPVEREVEGERTVLTLHLYEPENTSLVDIEKQIQFSKDCPLNALSDFRRAFRIGRLPRLLRRLTWWGCLNVSARWRQKYFGTFGITGVSSLGVQSLHFVSPLTSAITCGLIEKDGTAMFRMVYDHRVMDGVVPALALAELQKVLNEEILSELSGMARFRVIAA